MVTDREIEELKTYLDTVIEDHEFPTEMLRKLMSEHETRKYLQDEVERMQDLYRAVEIRRMADEVKEVFDSDIEDLITYNEGYEEVNDAYIKAGLIVEDGMYLCSNGKLDLENLQMVENLVIKAKEEYIPALEKELFRDLEYSDADIEMEL